MKRLFTTLTITLLLALLMNQASAQNTTCDSPSGPMAPVGSPPICYTGYTVENTGSLTQYYTFVAITPNMQVMLLPTVGTACSFPNTAIYYTNLRLYHLGDCTTPLASGAVFFGLTVGDTYVWGCTMTPADPICVWIAEACPSVMPSPLPAEINAFSASQRSEGVQLTWSIATAGAWSRFEVERSSSPEVGFTRIGTVAPEGSGQLDFQFHDASSDNGEVFYRLAMWHGEEVQHSEVISLNPSAESDWFQLYPNPSVKAPTLAIGGGRSAEFSIVGMDGRGAQGLGAEQLRQWMEDAAPGMYVVDAVADGEHQTQRWIKAD
jgi:hypothetical protein